MQLDLTLNALWLLVGILAIGMTLHASSGKGGSRGWRLAGIVLVLAALFPFISATDDILRVEHYSAEQQGASERPGTPGHGRQHSQRTTNGDDLVRLYEAMDAPLVPNVIAIAVVLLLISFVTVAREAILTTVAPSKFGRSPPTFFSAA